MLTIAAKTKMKPDAIIKRAVDFFGPKGYKLRIDGQDATGVTFEGGGGSVSVSITVEGKQTSVELTSREWDYQVKEFVGTIK